MTEVQVVEITDDELWEEKEYLTFVLANRVDYEEIEDRLSVVNFLLGIDNESETLSP